MESLEVGRKAHVSLDRDLAVGANLRRKRGVCFRDEGGSANVTLTDAGVQDDLAGPSDHGAVEMGFFGVHVPTLGQKFHRGLVTVTSAFESDLGIWIGPTVSCLWSVAARDGLANEMASCQMATCGGPVGVARSLRRPFLLFEDSCHVVTFWSPAHLATGFDYVCACSSLATLRNHVERHGLGAEGFVSVVFRDRCSDHVLGRRLLCLSAGQDFDGVDRGTSGGRHDHEAHGSDLYGCVGSLWSDGGDAMSGQSGPGCDETDCDERAGRRKRALEVCRICCCCWGGDLDSVCGGVELLGQEQDRG